MSLRTLRQGSRRARQEHECSVCTRTIGKGEVYQWQDNVLDDYRWTWRGCLHCEASTRRAIRLNDWWEEDGITGSWVHETLLDYAAHPTDLRAYIGMSRRWRHADGTLWAVPSWSEPAMIAA